MRFPGNFSCFVLVALALNACAQGFPPKSTAGPSAEQSGGSRTATFVFGSGGGGAYVPPLPPVPPSVPPAPPQAGIPECGAVLSESTTVGFYNGNGHSTVGRIEIPAYCPNAFVFATSAMDTMPCGNQVGPTPCTMERGTTYADIRPYLFSTSPNSSSPEAAQPFLSAEDGGWHGATSKAYEILVDVICNPRGTSQCLLPSAPDGLAFAGQAKVGFYNGRATSEPAWVAFPRECRRPRIVTQGVRDSILCGNGSGPTPCASSPGTTSRDLRVRIPIVNARGFEVRLEAKDGVWVGASSPQFGIHYKVQCDGF